jgi:hypothetical protein
MSPECDGSLPILDVLMRIGQSGKGKKLSYDQIIFALASDPDEQIQFWYVPDGEQSSEARTSVELGDGEFSVAEAPGLLSASATQLTRIRCIEQNPDLLPENDHVIYGADNMVIAGEVLPPCAHVFIQKSQLAQDRRRNCNG